MFFKNYTTIIKTIALLTFSVVDVTLLKTVLCDVGAAAVPVARKMAKIIAKAVMFNIFLVMLEL